MNTLAESATIDLVVFEAGGWRVAIEARRVRASRGIPTAGLELPTVESLMDLPASRQPAGARQCLTLNGPDGARDILIAGSVELLSVVTERIHPLPPLLAARNYLTGLRALILRPEGEVVLLFDSHALRFPVSR